MCTLHHHDVHVDTVTNLSASAARDAGACRGPCPIAPSMCTLHHHDVRVDNVTKVLASAARDAGACRGACPIAPSMCTLYHNEMRVDNVTKLSASAARDAGPIKLKYAPIIYKLLYEFVLLLYGGGWGDGFRLALSSDPGLLVCVAGPS
uniref:Uncharacterized protein n=1 Tax=Branchiostoma floridae TaxID=7739 RepID=C3Y9P3_BRAFL|eukprot:XP_002607289.1 hypothetical protein BRAFLDRAFT_88238 [Branchiostoma floridae]